MFAKWIRNIIARSLAKEVEDCRKCERADSGFHVYDTCEEHRYHIQAHNVLTSINK